ncbi:AAA family ATPase [Reichenbachiella sp. MALMAid0571]|uniref:AAA family ATPase n=1 Tax=Reichenbachiella sp. MALMAid0571 TaxID=3143939 RepID=UPI0032DE95C9
MYIKRIKFQNYGPISNLDVTPNFNDNGNPKPIVFIGKNGSGKTLLLGNILDGLIELKRQKFKDLLEVEQNKYLKVGKKDYIKYGEDYSNIEIQFENDGKTANYVDLMSRISNVDYISKYGGLNLKGATDGKFVKSGFYKNCQVSDKDLLDSFGQNIISFFPHSRYDHPAWLNKDTNIGFSFKEKFLDQSDKNIIKYDVIKEVETWILDCLLDREIYEKILINGQNGIQIFVGYNGKNNDIIKLINELLGIIYKSKFPNLQSARIGIGAKNRRSISIHIKEQNGEEFTVSPSFSHISSGEAMLLALFTALLKEYDDLGAQVRNLNDVKGIVIVDEIDLHLHIEFQKSILPELLKRFSGVQFILTTHSPFFLYGMEDEFKENWDLINLPFGNSIALNDFSEMKSAYNIFVTGFNELQVTLNTVNERLKNLTKPLVITEGKTDWKHLKNALNKLNEQGKFKDLDFDFLEYEEEIQMGDSHLKSLCEQTSKLKNDRKIICIFDRDDDKIIKQMGCDTQNFKDWGNSVYSFCIPKPDHRENYNKISIEFYYTDEEIKTLDKTNTTRLFFTNEVEELIIKSKTNNKANSEIRILGEPKEDEENDKRIYCKDVERIIDVNGKSLAHSKSLFAEKILNGKEDFNEFNISEFEKIFEVISEILT